jgi:hypothetical protein
MALHAAMTLKLQVRMGTLMKNTASGVFTYHCKDQCLRKLARVDIIAGIVVVVCVNQHNPNDSNRNIPNNLQQINRMSIRLHTLNHALTQHGKKEKMRMAVTIIAFPQMQMNRCKSPFTMC